MNAFFEKKFNYLFLIHRSSPNATITQVVVLVLLLHLMPNLYYALFKQQNFHY
jgi:hypothetical protein